MKNRILVFDIWGDFGHFKKPYTTTSPLSFAFPPRPTIAGMISAIIGLDKTEYLDHFMRKDADIAIKIIRPVKKMRISQNLIDTKRAILFSRIKQRTQIRFEYVKDPGYRVYFLHRDNNIYQQLKSCLENHESVYTVSLGLSELLANFEFVGEFDLHGVKNEDPVFIDSVLPVRFFGDNTLENGKAYLSENIPIEMNRERIVTQFGEVFYERSGKPVKAVPDTYFRIENGDAILFL